MLRLRLNCLKNYRKEHLVVLFVVLFSIEIIMLLLTFSDRDYNLFVKLIDISHFSEGSGHSYCDMNKLLCYIV